MKIIRITNVEKFSAQILPKQPQKNRSTVESILKSVQKNGDSAIRKYEKQFSGAKIISLRLSPNEIKDAFSNVSKNKLDAIRLAKLRLEKTEFIIKSILKNGIPESDKILNPFLKKEGRNRSVQFFCKK